MKDFSNFDIIKQVIGAPGLREKMDNSTAPEVVALREVVEVALRSEDHFASVLTLASLGVGIDPAVVAMIGRKAIAFRPFVVQAIEELKAEPEPAAVEGDAA